MTTKEILEQERDRDLLQPEHSNLALRAMCDLTSTDSRSALMAVQENFGGHTEQASVFLLNLSPALIADDVASDVMSPVSKSAG